MKPPSPLCSCETLPWRVWKERKRQSKKDSETQTESLCREVNRGAHSVKSLSYYTKCWLVCGKKLEGPTLTTSLRSLDDKDETLLPHSEMLYYSFSITLTLVILLELFLLQHTCGAFEVILRFLEKKGSGQTGYRLQFGQKWALVLDWYNVLVDTLSWGNQISIRR